MVPKSSRDIDGSSSPLGSSDNSKPESPRGSAKSSSGASNAAKSPKAWLSDGSTRAASSEISTFRRIRALGTAGGESGGGHGFRRRGVGAFCLVGHWLSSLAHPLEGAPFLAGPGCCGPGSGFTRGTGKRLLFSDLRYGSAVNASITPWWSEPWPGDRNPGVPDRRSGRTPHRGLCPPAPRTTGGCRRPRTRPRPSSAGLSRGSRPMRSRARRRAASAVTAPPESGSRPFSSRRRRARSATSATRKIFASASGNTDRAQIAPVAHQRALPPRLRCRSSSHPRTAGSRATAETCASTSGLLSSAVRARVPSITEMRIRRPPSAPDVRSGRIPSARAMSPAAGPTRAGRR